MELKDLKVKAYDLICEFEAKNNELIKVKKQLDAVNSEIFKLMKEEENGEELST